MEVPCRHWTWHSQIAKLTALPSRPAQVGSLAQRIAALPWHGAATSATGRTFPLAVCLEGLCTISNGSIMSAGEAKGKKQSGEEAASSGPCNADDELLNTKDLNFFGDASVIG